ncbi:MAG: YfcC family protein [Rubricoccaceae bacterium]
MSTPPPASGHVTSGHVAPEGSAEDAPRFRTPDTALIIFGIIVLAVMLTWVIPPGAFERATIEVEGAGQREVVQPGTFAWLERGDSGLWPRLRHSIGMVFLAPILGFTDPDAAPIIAFVLLIGGAFAVLSATGAVDAALRRLVAAAERSPAVQATVIPGFMTLFAFGGAVFGMAEETIPFVLIFVPLALALGYDSLTGVAIPFVGSAAGFASAFFNPFTVGVAQGIAQVPPFSGAGFRVVLWIVTTGLAIAFVLWHAGRVRRDPRLSPMWAADEARRARQLAAPGIEAAPLTGRQKAVLAIFFAGILVLVWGVLPPGRTFDVLGRTFAVSGQGWYINEIAALFVALGIVLGIVGGLGANRTARAFMEGVRDLAATALIIGLARGILVVMQDGQIIDPILHALSSGLADTHAAVAAGAMFGMQSVLNFFVPSGSGQAALTMPLMAPLSDLVGVSRQTAVLAFQMGDGFTNMIVPTSAVLMGVLSLAGVPWPTWARWVLPLQLVLFVLGLVALAVAVGIGYA